MEPPSTALGPARQLVDFRQQEGHAPKDLQRQLHPRRRPAGERDQARMFLRWSSLEDALGVQAEMGIQAGLQGRPRPRPDRRALAEQYIYDETSHHYLNRESLVQEGFISSIRRMTWSTRNGTTSRSLSSGKKLTTPSGFMLGEPAPAPTSSAEEFPGGNEPGAILRYSPLHGDRHGRRSLCRRISMPQCFPWFQN